MSSLIELRAYTLKPGMRSEFQQRFEHQILPMMKRFEIAVVSTGPSLHDEVSFHLVRRFTSLAAREEQLARFYGSEEWLTQHDADVMAMIETYSTCVVEES